MRHAGQARSPTRGLDTRWHLSKQGHVVIDCPKMAEALWPAASSRRARWLPHQASPVEQAGGVGGAVVAAEVGGGAGAGGGGGGGVR